MMHRQPVAATIFSLIALGMLGTVHLANAADSSRPVPPDRVVAMYFHRTQRCPTCLKMGGFTEEAIKSGFAREMKAGTVEFHYVDFQLPKNAALTKAYKITGPTLIVARVHGSKAQQYRNLKEIWSKVRDKSEFIKYVQANIAAYMKDGIAAQPAAHAGN